MKIQIIDTNKKDLGKQEVIIDGGGSLPIFSVTYEGVEYGMTFKTGTNVATGKEMHEMASDNDERLWISTDLTLINLD